MLDFTVYTQLYCSWDSRIDKNLLLDCARAAADLKLLYSCDAFVGTKEPRILRSEYIPAFAQTNFKLCENTAYLRIVNVDNIYSIVTTDTNQIFFWTHTVEVCFWDVHKHSASAADFVSLVLSILVRDLQL